MRTLLLSLLAFCALFLTSAHAVIVAGGNGTQNSTSTGAGAGWDYTGSIASGSAVYLGEYGGAQWALTAYHIGVSNGQSLVLPSGTFSYVNNSLIRLTNPNSSVTDLAVFQISGDPGLANLQLRSTSLSNGATLTAIGNGRNRATSTTTWYVDDDTTPDWTWSETPFVGVDGTLDGYKYASGNTMRWGTNTKQGTASTNQGYGQVELISFDFDNSTDEAMLATGDSGGGVFHDTGSGWELVGINDLVGGYSGQPADTAVFGDMSYAVDVSFYHDIILAAIPEPSTDALILAGASFIAVRFLRRRK